MNLADELTRELEALLTPQLLKKIAHRIVRRYNEWDINCDLWAMIRRAFPEKAQNLLWRYERICVADEVVNALAMRYYSGERLVKYWLAKESLSVPHRTVLFEYPVAASGRRLDFAYIDTSSHAFEIKTEADSLSKLNFQIKAYAHLFEYVHVLVHAKHVDSVVTQVPPHCGIEVYKMTPNSFEIDVLREAQLSPAIRRDAQIRNMSSRELDYILRLNGQRGLRLREERAAALAQYTDAEINKWFKVAVKNRYADNWGELVKHFDEIYPLDVQSFYRSGIIPWHKKEGQAVTLEWCRRCTRNKNWYLLESKLEK